MSDEVHLEHLDRELAERYGAYASFETSHDPIHVETFGDAPWDETDRLLDRTVKAESVVLDLGCGAGQTLCRLAPHCREIWGVDLERPLIEAAEARVQALEIGNARLIAGDTTHAATVDQLPDATFQVVFSRRGPFLTGDLMRKLTKDAVFLVELAQDAPGLKPLFGRSHVVPSNDYATGDWCIGHHKGLGWQPVSVKHYYWDAYFRDAEHLGEYLKSGAWLSNWWQEERPYNPVTDRAALELFARYHATPQGVRFPQHRKIYLFRRYDTDFYPMDAEIRAANG